MSERWYFSHLSATENGWNFSFFVVCIAFQLVYCANSAMFDCDVLESDSVKNCLLTKYKIFLCHLQQEIAVTWTDSEINLGFGGEESLFLGQYQEVAESVCKLEWMRLIYFLKMVVESDLNRMHSFLYSEMESKRKCVVSGTQKFLFQAANWLPSSVYLMGTFSSLSSSRIVSVWTLTIYNNITIHNKENIK